MDLDATFFLNNILLGVGLSMDAFSVSLSGGLYEPRMRRTKQLYIAGVFAFFQTAMPLIGWICVSTAVQYFHKIQPLIPWIALLLLSWIGGKMLWEGLHNKGTETAPAIGPGAILLQGVATSIDALSVGFTIAAYVFGEALLASLLIGAVTFLICFAGVDIGKRAGTRLAGKAGILGGVILIAIGLEIFISHWL